MDWEIYDGQLQRGPMPEEGVHDAIRAGLPRSAYVRRTGSSDWMPVEGYPPFAAAIQQRGAPGQWPPPPPPPPLVGSVPPVAPAAPAPPPTMPYAVSPDAGKPARRRLVGGGCLVQGLGILLLLGAGVALYGLFPLVVQAVAALAILGIVLLLVGGLLNVNWVCSSCRKPVARSAHICPSCRASFT